MSSTAAVEEGQGPQGVGATCHCPEVDQAAEPQSTAWAQGRRGRLPRNEKGRRKGHSARGVHAHPVPVTRPRTDRACWGTGPHSQLAPGQRPGLTQDDAVAVGHAHAGKADHAAVAQQAQQAGLLQEVQLHAGVAAQAEHLGGVGLHPVEQHLVDLHRWGGATRGTRKLVRINL